MGRIDHHAGVVVRGGRSSAVQYSSCDGRGSWQSSNFPAEASRPHIDAHITCSRSGRYEGKLLPDPSTHQQLAGGIVSEIARLHRFQYPPLVG